MWDWVGDPPSPLNTVPRKFTFCAIHHVHESPTHKERHMLLVETHLEHHPMMTRPRESSASENFNNMPEQIVGRCARGREKAVHTYSTPSMSGVPRCQCTSNFGKLLIGMVSLPKGWYLV